MLMLISAAAGTQAIGLMDNRPKAGPAHGTFARGPAERPETRESLVEHLEQYEKLEKRLLEQLASAPAQEEGIAEFLKLAGRLRAVGRRAAQLAADTPFEPVETTDWAVLLCRAGAAGNLAVVRRLLESGADPNAQDVTGPSALHLAAAEGRVKVVKCLLDAGADRSLPDHRDRSPLEVAAASGRLECVKVLLPQGVDLRTIRYENLLPAACAGGNPEIIELLIDRGADPNATSGPEARRPMHHAAAQGTAEVVEALLESGADPEGEAKRSVPLPPRAGRLARLKNAVARLFGRGEFRWTDETPLHAAAEAGNIEAVEALLEAGAEAGAAEPLMKETPLHRAVAATYSQSPVLLGRLPEATAVPAYVPPAKLRRLVKEWLGQRRETIRAIIDAGADVNATDMTGCVALHRAVQAGLEEAWRGHLPFSSALSPEQRKRLRRSVLNARAGDVKLLLDEGADPDATSDQEITPLHLAALCGLKGAATELLSHGASVDAASRTVGTPLHCAARAADPEMVKVLLKHGAAPSLGDRLGKTPLHLVAALEEGQMLSTIAGVVSRLTSGPPSGPAPNVKTPQPMKVAELLMDAGASPDAIDVVHGATPLYYAALAGNVPILKYLLEQGADPNAGRIGPLHAAASEGRVGVLNVLLEAGADVNRTGSRGETALFSAVSAGSHPAVRLLLKRGADVNAGGGRAGTPLHAAVSRSVPSKRLEDMIPTGGARVQPVPWDDSQPRNATPEESERTEMMRLLLESGADPHARTHDGLTPLHKSVAATARDMQPGRGHLYAASVSEQEREMLRVYSERVHLMDMKLLLAEGADANAADMEGRTPLHFAIASALPATTRLLLERGADVKARQKDGSTPLHVAARTLEADSVELLLGHRLDPNARNKKGATPLQMALAVGPEALEAFARSQGTAYVSMLNKKQLESEARERAHGVVKMLLDAGADPDVAAEGETPLIRAVEGNRPRCVKALLEAGADPDLPRGRRNALHQALLHRRYDMARGMIAAGADVDARSETGWVPLHETSRLGKVELTRLLLEKGADPNLGNDLGKTPLDMAISQGRKEVAKLLKEHGAVPGQAHSRASGQAVR